MPEHTNYRSPLIFGGAFMAKMDLAAAERIALFFRATYKERKTYAEENNTSLVDNAVTHTIDHCIFNAPSFLGDIIRLESRIIKAERRHIWVHVQAFRTPRNPEEQAKTEPLAEMKLSFVTQQGETYAPHNLEKIFGNEILECF